MKIYLTNDLHGTSQSLDWLEKNASSSIKKGEALFLDSGDALIGSNTVYKNYEPNLERMSLLGCTAMAMGNREFSYLRKVLDKRSEQRSFPLLCSNLCDLKETGILNPEDFVKKSIAECRKTDSLSKLGILHAERWVNSVIISDKKLSKRFSLLLMGAVPVQYPHFSFWEKLFKFRFFSPEESLIPIADHFADSEQPVRIIILSHLGLDRDKKMAEKLPPGTWILGGHTHTVLTEAVKAGDVFITQTGAHSQYIGELDYDIEAPEKSTYKLHRLHK